MMTTICLVMLMAAQAPPVVLAEAQVLLKQGKPADAIALLQRASADRPADAAIHNMLGALFNQSGRYREALTHAEAAVANAPDNARYRLNRGIVFVEHGRFAEAVADFDAALARDASFVYGYLERGSAYLSLDRAADARAQWALARKTDPKLIWPDWYEGIQDFIEGTHAEAAARFDRVAQAEPGFGPAPVWARLARGRAKLPIADATPKGDEWPAPLYRLQQGTLTLDQVLAIAKQDTVTGDPRRIGETLFVAAEMAAIRGRRSDARRLARRAIEVKAPRHAWKMAAERLAR